MGHPARIQLLEMDRRRSRGCQPLRDDTGLEPSNLSQHLGVLRRQRLIIPSRQDGRLFYEPSCPEVSSLLMSAHSLLGTVLQSTRLTLIALDESARKTAVR